MKHRDEILRLRAEGKTYKEIQELTGASKGTISFHCGKGQKQKSYIRNVKSKSTQHPFIKKIQRFQGREQKQNQLRIKKLKSKILLQNKINHFHYNRYTKEYSKISFKIEDVINKFGTNPKCYLTGKSIDIYAPRTYNFDHIMPVSKGGDNSIDNLGICTKAANQAKSDLTLDEFYQLCEDVVNFKKSGN